MDRAGFGVSQTAIEILKSRNSHSALLFAGKGNNGGDAIVAARHLAEYGYHPTLVLLCHGNDIQGDSLIHFKRLDDRTRVFELPTTPQLEGILAESRPAVVIDGLLGTGLKGDVREPYASAINYINRLALPVVAVDLPSGLDSDSGEPHGTCVLADVSVTMGLPKIGLLRPSATDLVGRIQVADIGYPKEFIDALRADVELITADDIRPLLPRRRRSAHKGDFGHLLIIAGSQEYTGAPVLAAYASARAGAGLVTLALKQDIFPIVAAKCPPEVMPRPLNFDKLDSTYFAQFDAVAIGPGLGQAPDIREMVWKVLALCELPMVVDADALNVIATDVPRLKQLHRPLVLTPHPGEMARLIGKTAGQVQSKRWEIANTFAKEHGVVMVLKGASTVVTDASSPLWVNSTGNPGMARGGMGDALTGVIGAYLARGMTPLNAARAGAFLHGFAADLALDQAGESGLLTSDLVDRLGEAIRLTSSDTKPYVETST